jgi:NUMOD4 motif/HNH endonuclease
MKHKEEWMPVEGYVGFYEVSSFGRVRSVAHRIPHRWPGTFRISKGKMLECYRRPQDGYLTVNLSRKNRQSTKRVHVLVARAFIANPDRLSDVNHIDGVKANCRSDNLEWSTHKGNGEHAGRLGLMTRGEAMHSSKLTAAQARAIYRSPMRQKDLVKLYGVARVTIYKIKHRITWAHATC